MSNPVPRAAALYLVTLFLTMSAQSQADDESAMPAASEGDGTQQVRAGDTASQRPIEEITVSADTNIVALRFRLREAEDAMYAQFNELNSRDEFDIDCKDIRHARSYIAQRSCEPKFLTRERQSNVIQVISQLRDGGVPGGGGLTGPAVNGGGSDVASSLNLNAIDDYQQSDAELRGLLSKKYEELSEDMFRIASENPEFLQALTRVESFRKAIVEAREERFGK